jgi:hypothetical protein
MDGVNVKFSTNARFITLKPETLQEANELWTVADRFRKCGTIKAERQSDGSVTVFIDLAATESQCLKTDE